MESDSKAERIQVVWESEIVPETVKFGLLTVRWRLFLLTERLRCANKSTLMMGVFTAGMVNSPGEIRFILRFNFNELAASVDCVYRM